MLNLTAHEVVVLSGPAVVARWAPTGQVARMVEVIGRRTELMTTEGTVPTMMVRYSTRVAGLPEPVEGVGYIVSRVMAAAVARDDLFFPAPEIRGPGGTIVGAGGLARFDHEQVGVQGADYAKG